MRENKVKNIRNQSGGSNGIKRVYPVEDVCIACKLCEVGCIVEHSKSKDIIKAYLEEKPRAFERTCVEEIEHVSHSLQCRHCIEPECVEACINGAMHFENGTVQVDRNHCVGCWMCIMACPYGVIRREPIPQEDRFVSSKCDLCPGREIPACVEYCPNRALVYEER